MGNKNVLILKIGHLLLAPPKEEKIKKNSPSNQKKLTTLKTILSVSKQISDIQNYTDKHTHQPTNYRTAHNYRKCAHTNNYKTSHMAR